MGLRSKYPQGEAYWPSGRDNFGEVAKLVFYVAYVRRNWYKIPYFHAWLGSLPKTAIEGSNCSYFSFEQMNPVQVEIFIFYRAFLRRNWYTLYYPWLGLKLWLA